ncbi:MAG: hypothetical protein CME06_05805 [Gemmatimonadetes bacterium]|nr:hypothetical protein [Gemmatimonadota bacterium]
MKRVTMAMLALGATGCLFGASESLRPLRVDSERPPVHTYLVQSHPSDAFDGLALELSRRLAADGAYGVIEVIEANHVSSLLANPFTWKQAGRVLIVRPEPFRSGIDRSTRIPYIWTRVASTTRAAATVTVFSSESDVLLPGAQITGIGRGDWSHRWLSSDPPVPPAALERRRMESAAVAELAERIGLELSRFENEAGQQLADSGGPS